ncbi:GNAT family N-acetyltransferase [Planococcus donghaensis]|uniref:GNAT family N-acetyltransferase n=1 Tax=Planococcus donghaensis TaxID=414778 RepID=A0A1C7EJ12_9BACL|nr:GNAT family N-acetyltransferase [Planococcus donghaensis]ANU23357.1 GNAT family N-acetyltransferase [Planococcus donghaensis]
MNIKIEKKYIPLANYFSATKNPTITLQFTEIEKIMGQSLPNAAYLSYSWWKKTKAPAKHYLAWTAAGYAVTHVEPKRYVIFVRIEAANDKDIVKANENILLIRPAAHGDASSLSDLQKKIEGESDFFLYGHGERFLSTQKTRKQIIEWNQNGHSLILLAILNGQHVGYLMIEGYKAHRASHRAGLRIGIQKDSQRNGIGSLLLQKAEAWSAEKGIHRLEVSVLETNSTALTFLHKHGYESEGIRRKALMIQQTAYDEIYLAKISIT